MIAQSQLNKKQAHLRWSEDEKRFLLKNAGNLSVAELAEELGKTEDSVKSQCSRLQVSYRTR